MSVSRYRVSAGYVLALLVVLLARPRPWSLLAGSALGLAGEALRVWASGHIDKTQVLATGGPYAHTRNPLYVGSLLLALGVGVASASVWVVLAVAAYFLGFYPAVVREEAAFLKGRFGPAYDAWAAAVPLFLPRPTPGGPQGTRFEWSRVRKNREWQAALALPAVVALLYARGRFLP